jgi:hypothetical protein
VRTRRRRRARRREVDDHAGVARIAGFDEHARPVGVEADPHVDGSARTRVDTDDRAAYERFDGAADDDQPVVRPTAPTGFAHDDPPAQRGLQRQLVQLCDHTQRRLRRARRRRVVGERAVELSRRPAAWLTVPQ